MTTNFPADLLALESRAWQEIQTGTLTVPTALAVHRAIADYVARDDVDAARIEVEEGLKRVVRHGEA